MFKVNFDIKHIDKLCNGIVKQLKSVKGARAGYIKDASYPEKETKSGKPSKSEPLKVWENALIQEYGTDKIPPRPFLRKSLKRQKEWVRFVEEQFDTNQDTGITLKQIAGQVGEMMKNAIKDSIDSNIPPPNAPSTLRAKAPATKTLKDTGLLSRSVQSEVIK